MEFTSETEFGYRSLSISEAAKFLNVTSKTLRNWDKEGIFKPDFIENGNRRYSQGQIERKSGKTLSQLSDPITQLADKEKIDDLIQLAGKKRKLDIGFRSGDVKDKYQALYFALIEASYNMYRNNHHSPPNFIFTSPEIGCFFEIATAGFASAPWGDEKGKEHAVLYIGKLNRRWKIYESYLMPVDELILGYVEDSRIIEKKGFVSCMKIDNVIAF
jgi:hypothetical protein